MGHLDIPKQIWKKRFRIWTLELMYDIVTEITSENGDLKTRLKAFEDLVTDGKHCGNRQRDPFRESGNPNAAQMTFPLRTNSSNNQINKNIDERKVTESDIKNNISLERKRKGKTTGDGDNT